MLKKMNLDRRLYLGLAELGFDSPTPIQEEAIPIALQGADLQICAPTGSGKTLAYLIPAAQRILSSDLSVSSGTCALILVPTRELARQVVKHARDLLRKTPLRVQGITGGTDFKYQSSLLRKDPEIVVATPGRLREHCERGSAVLDNLQTLVVDEADRMLDMGLRADVMSIIKYCGERRQVTLLSATLSHTGIGYLARSLLHSPREITLGERRQAQQQIEHRAILADNTEHKDRLVETLLAEASHSTLVFVNKRVRATRLANRLSHFGLRSACLHGDLSTEERKRVVQQLRDNKVQVVCATDVAARGLDIPELAMVINYDLPHSGDDYIHRCGRTGRAGHTGVAISLVNAAQWNLMVSIQRYLKLKFERRALPGLKAKFSGPKKQKKSGKAAGTKKKYDKNDKEKAKSRRRNKKIKASAATRTPNRRTICMMVLRRS